MSECVFCNVLSSESPWDFRWHSEVASFSPLNPVVLGHRLFVPREHVRDASTDPEVTADVFGQAANFAADRVHPFNLITSGGAVATQTVFHLHVHYVPRREGDGLLLPWSNQETP